MLPRKPVLNLQEKLSTPKREGSQPDLFLLRRSWPQCASLPIFLPCIQRHFQRHQPLLVSICLSLIAVRLPRLKRVKFAWST
eukprot:6176695-Pleurochrysis_carterae.AAC.1